MGLRIQNNVEAFNAHRQLTATAGNAAKAMEKLSSGYRINRAGDDAAGLAISEKMRGQIGGLAQAQRNAQDGISLVQTGEGALAEVHSMLQRVRDLKVQYSNGTLSSSDKTAIDAEFKQLKNEIGDIRDNTSFNKVDLLKGSSGTNVDASGNISFQVGANAGETIKVKTVDLTGANGTSAVTNQSSLADVSIADLDTAIENVSTIRSDFGSVQNRLEHRLTNLGTYQENLVAAESRIRDVDMAAEMVNFSKQNILQQAGQSMLAQANQAPQGVLSLLR
jgi:flagellin